MMQSEMSMLLYLFLFSGFWQLQSSGSHADHEAVMERAVEALRRAHGCVFFCLSPVQGSL